MFFRSLLHYVAPAETGFVRFPETYAHHVFLYEAVAKSRSSEETELPGSTRVGGVAESEYFGAAAIGRAMHIPLGAEARMPFDRLRSRGVTAGYNRLLFLVHHEHVSPWSMPELPI
jgi:hypothetical protein